LAEAAASEEMRSENMTATHEVLLQLSVSFMFYSD